MKPKDFESLERSLLEVGEIMRSEKPPAREFSHEVDRSQIKPPVKTWAVYVDIDEEGLLIAGKLYEVEISQYAVYVRDEEGESTICSRDSFMPVPLPAEVVEKLSELKKAA